MKCRRIIGDRHTYWNIKGWGHFAVFVCANCLSFRLWQRAVLGTLWHHFGTALKGKVSWVKKRFLAIFDTLPPTCGKKFAPLSKNVAFVRASIPHRRL